MMEVFKNTKGTKMFDTLYVPFAIIFFLRQDYLASPKGMFSAIVITAPLSYDIINIRYPDSIVKRFPRILGRFIRLDRSFFR